MASIISAGTSSGTALNMTADTSGQLQLATGASATTAITIDTSQNVGIGTSSPNSKLQVSGTAEIDGKLTISPSANTTVLDIENPGNRSWFLDTSGNNLTWYSNYDSHTNPILAMASNSSGGNVLVGTTTALGKFTLKSSGNTSGTNTLSISNSSGTELFYIRDDGAMRTGQGSQSPYNYTAAVSANAFINTDGTLLRATSSLKYKKNVQDALYGLSDVLKLRPVTYQGLSAVDGDKFYGGLIAEEVDKIGLTQFVQYAEDGTPDALAYGNMVSLLTAAIQEQQTIINDLKARIETLEGAK